MHKTLLRIVAPLALFVPLAAADFLPLQPGYTWVYRAENGRQEFTIRVGLNPVVIDGKVYNKLTGYVPEEVYIRADEAGSLYAVDLETRQETLLTSFEPSEPNWYHAPKRACDQESQVAQRRVPYSGSAGNFEKVLSLQYRNFNCADAGVLEELYAENIGMLRRVEQTIAGPVRYDLVYASLGSVTVAEAPRASFHLTIRPSQDDLAVAVLRMEAAGGLPVKLTFPTTQEYDVILRDSDRNRIWQWSDGQFFATQISDKTVVALSYEVRIPREPDGRRLPAGMYVVEAWLTTVGGQRQFAASASLQITGNQQSGGGGAPGEPVAGRGRPPQSPVVGR